MEEPIEVCPNESTQVIPFVALEIDRNPVSKSEKDAAPEIDRDLIRTEGDPFVAPCTVAKSGSLSYLPKPYEGQPPPPNITCLSDVLKYEREVGKVHFQTPFDVEFDEVTLIRRYFRKGSTAILKTKKTV